MGNAFSFITGIPTPSGLVGYALSPLASHNKIKARPNPKEEDDDERDNKLASKILGYTFLILMIITLVSILFYGIMAFIDVCSNTVYNNITNSFLSINEALCP